AHNNEPALMRALNDLLVAKDDLLGAHGLSFGVRIPDVVDALEDDHMRDAGDGQHVAVKTGDETWTRAERQHAVSTDPGVDDAFQRLGARFEESSRENVGPPPV